MSDRYKLCILYVSHLQNHSLLHWHCMCSFLQPPLSIIVPNLFPLAPTYSVFLVQILVTEEGSGCAVRNPPFIWVYFYFLSIREKHYTVLRKMSQLFYSILFQTESTARIYMKQKSSSNFFMMMQKFSKKNRSFLINLMGTQWNSYNKLLGPNSVYMPSKVSELNP